MLSLFLLGLVLGLAAPFAARRQDRASAGDAGRSCSSPPAPTSPRAWRGFRPFLRRRPNRGGFAGLVATAFLRAGPVVLPPTVLSGMALPLAVRVYAPDPMLRRAPWEPSTRPIPSARSPARSPRGSSSFPCSGPPARSRSWPSSAPRRVPSPRGRRLAAKREELGRPGRRRPLRRCAVPASAAAVHRRLLADGPIRTLGADDALFYREGATDTVAVVRRDYGFRDPEAKSVLVNGIAMTATVKPVWRYMSAEGHLPALLAPAPSTALVICVGTGITLGRAGVPRHGDVHRRRRSQRIGAGRASGLRSREPRHRARSQGASRSRGRAPRSGAVGPQVQPDHARASAADRRGVRAPVHARLLRAVQGATRCGGRRRPVAPAPRTEPGVRAGDGADLSRSLPARSALAPLDSRRRADRVRAAADAWIRSRLAAAYAAPATRQSLAAAYFETPEALLGTYLLDRVGIDRWSAGADLVTDDRPFIEFFRRYGRTMGDGDIGTLLAPTPGSLADVSGDPSLRPALEAERRAHRMYLQAEIDDDPTSHRAAALMTRATRFGLYRLGCDHAPARRPARGPRRRRRPPKAAGVCV